MKITSLEKIKLERSKRFWSLVIYIPLAVVILCVLFGVFTEALGFTTSWEENFEEYELGQLSTVAEKWTGNGRYWVKDDDSYNGFKSGYVDSTGVEGYQFTYYDPDSDISSGIYGLEVNIKQTYWYDPTNLFSFDFFTTESHQLDFKFINEDEDYWSLRGSTHEVDCSDGSFTQSASNIVIDADTLFEKNVWSKIFLTINFSKHTFKISGNNGVEDTDEKCFWFNNSELDETLEHIRVSSYRTRGYFDYFNMAEIEGKVWAITPASSTEITSLGTAFGFGWQDLDDWDTLSVVFQNRATGIFSQAKQYEIETIGTSGQMELSFQDFNFDKNGKFYFYAVASVLEVETIEDMFLTGGYSYRWSDDLVDPEHWFAINITGLTSIFEMSDYETWYSETAKFTTSTAMFISIAGFFDPIFSKIGEFGSRIVDYFDVDEAYAQGYEMGRAIPYFAFFVEQTALFLGGFPILKWLFVIILLLVGIFIFRLILKFIPGLG